MSARKNIPNARERILAAAVSVFAEDGYDGARVDGIAAKAGVPKSLIYYHFPCKEQLLATLEKQLLEEYRSFIEVGPDESHRTKAEKIAARRNDYRNFMASNADLMRVIFVESLKKSRTKPPVFEVLESLISFEDTIPGLKEADNYERDERLVAEFFTNIVPMIASVCFCEQWKKYFKMNNKRFDELFARVFEQTHGAYHRYHD